MKLSKLLLIILVFVSLPFQLRADGGKQMQRISLEDLRQKYSDSSDQYIDIEGTSVHYKDEGQGPPLLLIHGSTSTLRSFDSLAEILKSRYRVIRYDVPPTGLSGAISEMSFAYDVVKSSDQTVGGKQVRLLECRWV